LTKAQALAEQQGVTITTQVADLAEWDGFGSNKWDAIVSIFAHLPPAVRKHVHQACVPALKPGGALLLEAYTPLWTPSHRAQRSVEVVSYIYICIFSKFLARFIYIYF
jgi:hypothetical protein